MIYDDSLVRFLGEKIKPSDMALMFACVDSDFTGLCDEIFDADDVASKMVFNIVLNFLYDTGDLDMFDIRKFIDMPQKYWNEWDKCMRKIDDVPTPTELSFWYGESL